jgi:nicotinate-nucleotide pyrophosphorylase (carboxylating)
VLIHNGINMSAFSFDMTPAALQATIERNVRDALAEDLGSGDLTAALVPLAKLVQARIITRDDAVICGKPWAEEIMRQAAPNSVMVWQVDEGARCAPNTVIFTLDGPARELLSAERSLLNFVQLLSAVATKTAGFVKAVQGTKAKIVDTRKTLPGLRVAQKYAVAAGGGTNHRMGLHDAVLIKENHIAAAGGVTQVLAAAAAAAPNAKFVEIEVETLDQLKVALDAGARMVLLDNMSVPTLLEAVKINAGRAILEISGGVTMATLRELAETGVDRISIGTLTKDVQAVDLSMRVVMN